MSKPLTPAAEARHVQADLDRLTRECGELVMTEDEQEWRDKLRARLEELKAMEETSRWQPKR